jgi:hypothetical protein
MNKAQAINEFWNSFGLPAYDENSVPDDAKLPYITYSVETGKLDDSISMTGDIFYNDTSWKDITLKADEIAQAFEYGHVLMKIDNGYLAIYQGSPFSQRIGQDDDYIRRIYIILQAEFLTAY